MTAYEQLPSLYTIELGNKYAEPIQIQVFARSEDEAAVLALNSGEARRKFGIKKPVFIRCASVLQFC